MEKSHDVARVCSRDRSRHNSLGCTSRRPEQWRSENWIGWPACTGATPRTFASRPVSMPPKQSKEVLVDLSAILGSCVLMERSANRWPGNQISVVSTLFIDSASLDRKLGWSRTVWRGKRASHDYRNASFLGQASAYGPRIASPWRESGRLRDDTNCYRLGSVTYVRVSPCEGPLPVCRSPCHG